MNCNLMYKVRCKSSHISKKHINYFIYTTVFVTVKDLKPHSAQQWRTDVAKSCIIILLFYEVLIWSISDYLLVGWKHEGGFLLKLFDFFPPKCK